MALTATYASTSSFTVVGDKTADFIPGRAVLCDCGSDGLKYGYVSYSSYAAPNTTVVLDTTDGQAITSNLTTVNWAREKFTKTTPLEMQWLIRGLQTVAVTYKDADEVSLKPGVIYIDDGTTKALYRCDGFDKQLTGLSTSSWYYIYAQPPTNGRRITATEITYVTTAPTLDSAKQGYYHPSNANQRCIGFAYSDGSSNVAPFAVVGNLWKLTDSSIAASNGATPSNSWTDVTLSVPIGNIQVLLRISAVYVNAGVTLSTRKNGLSGSGQPVLYVDSTMTAAGGHFFVDVDSSKIFEHAFSGATTNTIYSQIVGFIFPSEIYTSASGTGAAATPSFHPASRGLQSIAVSFKDTDEIYISAGAIHIWGAAKEDLFYSTAQLTKQLTSLSASTWYAIYVTQPASGNIIGTGDISYSTTAPTYDQSKMGWYNGSSRCIGFVWSNGSSNIGKFSVVGGLYKLDTMIENLAYSSGNINVSTDVTLSIPLGSIVAHLHLTAVRYSTTDTGPALKTYGASDAINVSWVSADNVLNYHDVFCEASSDKKVTYYAAGRFGGGVGVIGFLLPNGIYTGPAGGLARQISGGGLSTKDVGHRNGCTVRWSSATAFTVDSGSIHLQDGGMQGMYDIPSQLSKTGLSGLSTAWYAVYAGFPASGFTLAAADITYETTMPTYDQTKRGWYHPTTTTKRCIGFFYASGATTVMRFQVNGNRFTFTDNKIDVMSDVAPSNTFTTYTFTVPLGPILAICMVQAAYVNSANESLWIRDPASALAGTLIGRCGHTGAGYFIHDVDIHLDASKQVQFKWGGATTNTISTHVRGIVLPEGI